MKISLNWIKEYTDVDISIDELVQKIGRQLGAVEEVIELGPKYSGVVIVKVVQCEKHPNADRLNVCFIDDGGVTQNVERNQDGLVQVVCGAPNVRAGLTVAWLPPGATVPSSYDTDPFVLEPRELRGVVSNGMLASAQELAIGDDHSGILELDESAPGTSFAEQYNLNDIIIDIENKMFTHRPDCFGILGVAREIAGISGKRFVSPEWYLNHTNAPEVQNLPLQIDNQLPELVKRFDAVVMSDVQIKPSPVWLRVKLASVGLKPINNIVDMTNYLMYLTGQPLHAYDYDKVAARSNGEATLVVRHPGEDETISLLNGKTITPRSEAIMIATDKELIGVGGVMGGSYTEVDDQTKNIIIECAHFDMYSIRRTSMAHGLFTDAVTRFNKGQSPLQNRRVLLQAMQLTQELSGGQQASSVIDVVNCDDINVADDGWIDNEVVTTASFINARLGLALTDDEIIQTLTNVEFGADKKDDAIALYAPFWRTDIEIPEDIVEEVGRLKGYEQMPLDLPPRSTAPAGPESQLQCKALVRNTLARLGANEILSYSFVHGKLLERTGQDPELAFKLNNAISPDLQYYRMSLTPSVLSHVHHNIKSGYNEFVLFELGKSHNKRHIDDDNGVPKEYSTVSLVYSSKTSKQPGYYHARRYLDELAAQFGVTLQYRPIETDADYPMAKPFEPSRSALVFAAESETALGIIGEYRSSVRKQLKLPEATAGFEIGLHELQAVQRTTSSYRPLSRFPSVTQDICLEVPQSVTYGQLTQEVQNAVQAHINEVQTVDVHPIDIYTSDALPDKQRITYRIRVTNYERTLTEAVVTGMLEELGAHAQQTLNASRI